MQTFHACGVMLGNMMWNWIQTKEKFKHLVKRSLYLQSRTKLLENFYPTMHTIQRNNTISTTSDLRHQIPLPPGQCCFLQMSKDQGCFRTHNNIAPKGRGEGGTPYSENVSKNGLGMWHFLNSFVQDCRSEHHHLSSMMVTRFSKKKDHPCFTNSCVCCANQRPILD